MKNEPLLRIVELLEKYNLLYTTCLKFGFGSLVLFKLIQQFA